MTQKQLFRELEFTRENVLVWANDSRGDKTAEAVLREALFTYYSRDFASHSKEDLIEEVMAFVMDGVDRPVNASTLDQLLDEVMEVCAETFDFATMDDFVRIFVKGEW